MHLPRTIVVCTLIVLSTMSIFPQDTKENADFKLAVNLYRDKMYDLALEQFRQFISSFPASPQSIEARYYIALTQRSAGKTDDARIAFQNFALTYPDHPKAPEAWWNIGELYQSIKKYADAASAYERIKVFHPKSKLAPKALLTAGSYFLLAGSRDDAKKSYLALINEYPSNELIPSAHAALGEIYISEGNLIAGKKEFQKAIEGGGQKDLTARVAIQLGSIAEAEGNPAEAERQYRSASELNVPDSLRSITAQGSIQLGRIYTASGREVEAIELLKKIAADSLVIDRGTVQNARRELASLYYKKNDFPRAIAMFERAVPAETDSFLRTRSMVQLADAYEKTKNIPLAIASYSAAASGPASAPEKRIGLIRAALLLQGQKEYIAAITFFNSFTDLYQNDPESPRIILRTADIYDRILKNYEKAADTYKQFHSRYPFDADVDEAAFAYARCLENLGSSANAIEAYRIVVSTYPASSLADEAQKRIELLQLTRSPDKQQSVEQLALLLGDLILEKPKAGLALRLGDIYMNIMQDFKEAEDQFKRAAELSTDSLLREEATYKLAVAIRRRAYLEAGAAANAIDAFSSYLRVYPNGKFADEASYQQFLLQVEKGDNQSIIKLAERYLHDFPTSKFAAQVMYSAAVAEKEGGLLSNSIAQTKSLIITYPLHPAAGDALGLLGIQLARSGALDTAVQVMKEYINTYPSGRLAAEVLYEMGKMFLRDERYAEAIFPFEQLRQEFFYTSFSQEAAIPLADAYSRTKQFEKSIAIYRNVLTQAVSQFNERRRDYPALVLSLARMYDASGDTASARIWYLRAANEDPRSAGAAEIYQRLALFEKNCGRTETAQRLLEQSISAQRTSSNTSELASLCFEKGNYAKAISEYQPLLTMKGIDSSAIQTARRRIAVAYYRSGKLKEADGKAAEHMKIFKLDREASAEFDLEKALLLYRNEQFDKAKPLLFQFTLRHDSTAALPHAMYWMGKILETENLSDSALKIYQTILRTNLTSAIVPKVYLALGNIYFNQEKYDESVKYYRLIVDNPGYAADILPYAINNLIQAYKEVGLYDGAMELIRTYIERYPNDESILDKKIDLGVLYQKLGYYDQSIVQLQSILESANKDLESEIRYYIGESYYNKGDYQQAILEFLKVPDLVTKKTKIDWTPNSDHMTAQSYEKMGKFDQALNMYQQILDKSGIEQAFKTAAQKEINRVRSLIRKDNQ